MIYLKSYVYEIIFSDEKLFKLFLEPFFKKKQMNFPYNTFKIKVFKSVEVNYILLVCFSKIKRKHL